MANCNICGNFVPDAQYQVHAMSCFSSKSAPGAANYQSFADSFSKGFENARRQAEEKARFEEESKRQAEEMVIQEDKFVLIAKGLDADLAEANARNLARLKKLEVKFFELTSGDIGVNLSAFIKQKTSSQYKYFLAWGVLEFLLIWVLYIGASISADSAPGSLMHIFSNIILGGSLILLIMLSLYSIYAWIQFMRSVDKKVAIEVIRVDKFSMKFFEVEAAKLQKARLTDLGQNEVRVKNELKTLEAEVSKIPAIPFLDLTDFRSELKKALQVSS